MSTETGREAVELCAMAGLQLDPWEAFVLENSLAERPDGRWAAFEVGVNVARQNGKGSIEEGRELVGLFLLGEPLITHSAHQFDTSLNHFSRLLELIEGTPDFSRRVKRVSRSHGEEGIELRGGQKIRFRTRTKGGGRGFTGDLVVLDEAMFLPDMAIGALMPTLSARSVQGNPQLWYAGSAVDQFVHDDGLVFARIRNRALAGGDPSLAYFEWSVDAQKPDMLTEQQISDQELWAQANPGLGIRISAEHIANEQRSMDARTFAVERLGVGDWPAMLDEGSVIPLAAWRKLADGLSAPLNPVCFAFDVSPNRGWASIAAAGFRADGLAHVEITDRRRGTGWVTDRLRELIGNHGPVGVICDDAGPGASLLLELEDLTVEVMAVNARQNAEACGRLYDAVEQQTIRHLGSAELESAVKGAVSRPLGDKWAWARKQSSADITPLVAATLAYWGISASGLQGDQGMMVAFA